MQSQTITPKNWVTDLGDFYTPEQEAKLNSIISDYEKKTSIEIGVVTVESLGDNSIEEFANTQFNTIGIGKKGADNGILIVFSKNDRKSRIETGNGMEPFLTDLDTHEALQVIKPYFRSGDYTTGTEDCIKYITNKLGNEAFSNKVQWLKEKKAREAKESEAAWESFKSGLIKFILVASFIAILVFIYFLDKARREKIRLEQERVRKENERKQRVKDTIVAYEKELKGAVVYKPSINSKILLSAFYNVEAYVKTLNVINQGSDNDDVYLSKLSNTKNILSSKVSAFLKLESDIKNKANSVNRLSLKIDNAKSLNYQALKAVTDIKRYGYDKSYSDLTNDINRYDSIRVEIENLLKTDVDQAINDSDDLSGNIDYLTSRSNQVITYLNSIKSAESTIKLADSTFKSKIESIKQYKSHVKSGEIEKLESAYAQYKTKSNTNDILALVVAFGAVIALTEGVLSTVRGRKSAQEAAERKIREAAEAEARRKRQREEDEERRRRNSYSSSSSYGSSYGSSSSSSSSDFGGFGGGSSSGGGSSDSW